MGSITRHIDDMVKEHGTLEKYLESLKPRIKMKTRGNVVVEEIKIGDIHYEYGYFKEEIKAQVMSLPVCKDVDGHMQCSWDAQIIDCPDKSRIGETINYMVTDGYQHYSDPLYTYQAYVKIGEESIEK